MYMLRGRLHLSLNWEKEDKGKNFVESFEVYSDTFSGGTISSRPIFESNKWWYFYALSELCTLVLPNVV